jgi:membrane-associated phospholipid phosphatase
VLADYVPLGFALLASLFWAGWWVSRRHGPAVMAAALWAPVGVLVAAALREPLEHLVTARQAHPAPHLIGVFQRSGDLSLPSDHAAMAGAAVAGLLLVRRPLGALAGAVVALMCLGHFASGVDDAREVVAGMVLGIVVSLAGFAIAKAPLVHLITLTRSTRLRPLLGAGSGTVRGKKAA